MFEHELSHALRDLTSELREMRQERMLGLATKCDLLAMEQRLVAAIGNQVTHEDRALLDEMLKTMERRTRKLEALDAKTSA